MAMRWLLVVTKAEKERVSNLLFRYEEGENGIKKTALGYVKRSKTKKSCELVIVLSLLLPKTGRWNFVRPPLPGVVSGVKTPLLGTGLK
jgi:hypothetical protein